MVKKINILGIELDNCTVRESIQFVSRVMNEGGCSTVVEVDMDLILMAEHDENLRNAIASIDHSIIADTGILKAANQLNLQRKREVEDEDFFYEYLKRLAKNSRSVFVVGKTDADVDAALNFIRDEFERINISGAISLEGHLTDEAVVNNINGASPDVVISVMPSPDQEYFVEKNRKMILANVWYGIGNTKFENSKKGFLKKLKKNFSIKRIIKLNKS